MMMHAFHEIYLSNVRNTLGEALDYAVNTCGISGSDFIKLFVSSSVSTRIENGEPGYLAGKSGYEIAKEVYLETTGKELLFQPQAKIGRSAEYWIGWAAAYYQWYSARKYQEIFKAVSFEEMKYMYPTLHEADISKFVDIAEARIRECFPETNLKRLRTVYGCSQSELSQGSGVSLRSIQMYEQRKKDINRASVETVYRLARFLGCTVEDLIER